MGREPHSEVVVVGADPVGCGAASQLASRGVDVELFDDRLERDEASGSVLLYRETLSALSAIGIKPGALGDECVLDRVGIYEGGVLRMELSLDEEERPIVVRRAMLERALLTRIEEQRVPFRLARRVTRLRLERTEVALCVGELDRDTSGYAVMSNDTVVTGTHEESAAWVVASDGRDSTIRTQIDVEVSSTAEAAIVANFELDSRSASEGELRIVFDGDLSAVGWPSPDGYHLGVRVPDANGYREALRSKRPYPTVRDLVARLEDDRPWFSLDADRLVAAEVDHVQTGRARSLAKGRVFLAGEAAHSIDPLTHRDLNEGMIDALELAERIADAVDDPSKGSAIATFLNDREASLEHMATPERWFAAAEQKTPFVAECAGRLVVHLPLTEEKLDRAASRLGIARAKAAP